MMFLRSVYIVCMGCTSEPTRHQEQRLGGVTRYNEYERLQWAWGEVESWMESTGHCCRLSSALSFYWSLTPTMPHSAMDAHTPMQLSSSSCYCWGMWNHFSVRGCLSGFATKRVKQEAQKLMWALLRTMFRTSPICHAAPQYLQHYTAMSCKCPGQQQVPLMWAFHGCHISLLFWQYSIII